MKITTSLLIGYALLWGATASAQTATPPADNQPMVGAFSELPSDHVLGAEDAPLSMIIYASVTCPHCSAWFNSVWPDLKKEYVQTGKLRVVFREYPTTPANLSVAGFQLAHCAGESEYFSYIEYLMLEQARTFKIVAAGDGLKAYLEHAKRIGLNNEEEMVGCFQKQPGLDHIQNSVALAKAGGVGSVPAFIVGGQPYKANSEYLPLSKYLDGLLDRQSTPLPRP